MNRPMHDLDKFGSNIGKAWVEGLIKGMTRTYTVNSPTRTFTWPLYQRVPWYRRLFRFLARR